MERLFWLRTDRSQSPKTGCFSQWRMFCFFLFVFKQPNKIKCLVSHVILSIFLGARQGSWTPQGASIYCIWLGTRSPIRPSVRVGFETPPSRTQRSPVNSLQLSLHFFFVYFLQICVFSLLFELLLSVQPQQCFMIHSGIVTGPRCGTA